MMVSSIYLQNNHMTHFVLIISNTNLFCCIVADDFFSRLGPSSTSGPATQTTSVPEPSIEDKAKGKKPIEGAPPSGTSLPKESYIPCEKTAPSSSNTSIGDTSRKDSTEVPKDPLDNFVVPLAGTPHGEGSFHLSGLFP